MDCYFFADRMAISLTSLCLHSFYKAEDYAFPRVEDA
jgi:hypothetical protein